MKRLPFAMMAMILFAVHARAEMADVKPTPTPVAHRYGAKSKSSARTNTSSDDETPKPKHRSSTTKKTVKKTDSDEGSQSKATPTPARKRVRKQTADDSEDSKKPDASPSPASLKKKLRKKIAEDELDENATPEPTPQPSPSPSALPTLQSTHPNSAPNASLTSDEIAEFARQPENVRKLLESALELTRQNLTYTYGSADPENGGMDCSGFVYYVLRQNGFDDVPRDASGQYVWVRKAKLFQSVLSTHKDTFELADLRPGDLLFWTGTYSVQKDPPITHTMIYLGTEKATHKSVMVGSTDGRTYNGKSRWGVSVFDFKANAQPAVSPDVSAKQTTHAAFVGYAHIPGLRNE